MTLGFIGTGSIAAAVVKGLCRADPAPDAVLVSPRNAEKAAALAAEFPLRHRRRRQPGGDRRQRLGCSWRCCPTTRTGFFPN